MSGRGRPRTPDILTPREWEVLDLLRAGLSNLEIAERLQISLAGAKYHVSEIISKLGVSSREEAASWRPPRRWSFAPAALFGGQGLTSMAPLKLAATGVLLLIAIAGGALALGAGGDLAPAEFACLPPGTNADAPVRLPNAA